MCGIIGGRLDDRFRNNIEKWIKLLSHRGEKQGYGMLTIDPTSQQVVPYKTLKLTEIVEEVTSLVDDTLILLHFRKASIGKVGLPLTHPITVGNTSVIHNGTNKDIFNLLDVSSDTEGVTTIIDTGGFDLLNHLDNDLGVVFAVDTVSSKIKVHIDESRPLCYSDGVYASEPLFDGLWSKVLPCHLTTDYTNFSKLELTDPISVTVEATSYHCFSCGKDHLHGSGNACNVCVLEGNDYVSRSSSSTGGWEYINYQDVAGVRYYTDGRVEILNKSKHGKKNMLTIKKGETYYPLNSSKIQGIMYDWIYGHVVKGGNTLYVIEDFDCSNQNSMWFRAPKLTNTSETKHIRYSADIFEFNDFIEYLGYDGCSFIDFESVIYTEKLVDMYQLEGIIKTADNKYFIQPVTTDA